MIMTRVRAFRMAMAAVAFLLAGAAACAEGLAGSEWRPLQIGEHEPVDSSRIFLRFEAAGRLSGHNGCNGFFGSYEITGDRIAIGPLGATQMACEQPVMELESAFMLMLGQARGFTRDGARLVLTDDEGHTCATFVQTDWD